mgnify:CR=1 FL=1
MKINKSSITTNTCLGFAGYNAQSTTYYCFLAIIFSLGARVLFMLFNDLLVEEAYYWNYSAHLDFGYVDHPPMVALLIKAAEITFGYSVWAIRIPTLLCWLLTAWFINRLTKLMAPEVEWYWPVMLLSLLPFFFLQSLVITPDAPMLVSWAALLYYLYRCLVLGESKTWYLVGLWFGLGLLSKYTISLLTLPIFAYIFSFSEARKWLLRKEPYLAVGIALLLFSPVIYWNASHQWASFLFQSTRRLDNEHAFTLHQVVCLLALFLTPMGIIALQQLILYKRCFRARFAKQALHFIQFFTFVPIGFFALYSIRHPVKFNWIGPSLLALIPWMAYCVRQSFLPDGNAFLRDWSRRTIAISVAVYMSMLVIVSSGVPHTLYRLLFTKFIGWEKLARDFHAIADDIAMQIDGKPSFVPLDRYNIASELTYYQQHWVNIGESSSIVYSVIGAHIFNIESLMFKYWDMETQSTGKNLILISPELSDFANSVLKDKVVTRGPMKMIWAYSQRGQNPVRPYYYQWVQLK